DFIISILFTADFIRARELFLFQNIGDFLRICSWLFATILLAKGYFKINAILEVMFSIIFPVLVKFLIINFGLNAVSIAYSITYALYFIVVCIIYCWHLTKKAL
ncbi:O-antigen flippase, partial [Escherichia coli]|nr:O-antigen flippase [Escherichia coli]